MSVQEPTTVTAQNYPPSPRSWTFTTSGIPPSPNRHLHWAERWRRTAPLRDEVAWQVKAARPPLLNHARVTLTFIRRGGRVADVDNLYAMGKALADGLVLGGILVDDSPAHITLEVRQARGGRRMVSILVEEVEGR